MDGWNTIVSFWGPAYYQVQTVSFKECFLPKKQLDIYGIQPACNVVANYFSNLNIGFGGEKHVVDVPVPKHKV